jgi:diacylglycerol O-acyltransferase
MPCASLKQGGYHAGERRATDCPTSAPTYDIGLSGAADTITRVDNTLAYMDQGSFLGLQALGRAPVIQVTWIYDRPVDIDGLRRFHCNLGHGLLGRLIECSPLPFGRHRWVSEPRPAELEIAAQDRARSDVWTWADERICLPIDPETGPAWRLGVQPLTNGGAAVALVASHSVADALGLSLSIADAANGIRRNLHYPLPGSRTRRQAVIEDGKQTVRALPGVAKAVMAAARVARAESDGLATSMKPSAGELTPGKERSVVAPTVAAYFDLDHWDERSRSLGGTSNSLFTGLAARLGQILGRVDDDGRVKLTCPVNERTDGDTRANALTAAIVTADPSKVTDSLVDLRADMKRTLTALSESPKDLLAPLPLVPFTPKALARLLEKMFTRVGSPIGCSNLGELDPAVNRPDGTDADYIAFRQLEPQITTHMLDRMGGYLFLGSGRVHGQIFVTVGAWTAGGMNTKESLRRSVGRVLAELQLSGIVE